ncbi:hypothetical protein AAF712_015270 [Marasmius tenuissimus]|uniref:Uncharacterized protein n=1 Tax=Marasmius tenuissimus TaxID=585030 RepID=A0ABR2ZAZ0_9AGAR
MENFPSNCAKSCQTIVVTKAKSNLTASTQVDLPESVPTTELTATTTTRLTRSRLQQSQLTVPATATTPIVTDEHIDGGDDDSDSEDEVHSAVTMGKPIKLKVGGARKEKLFSEIVGRKSSDVAIGPLEYCGNASRHTGPHGILSVAVCPGDPTLPEYVLSCEAKRQVQQKNKKAFAPLGTAKRAMLNALRKKSNTAVTKQPHTACLHLPFHHHHITLHPLFLHYHSLLSIKEDIDVFIHEWNSHPISGVGHEKSPKIQNLLAIDMRLLGMIQHGVYNDEPADNSDDDDDYDPLAFEQEETYGTFQANSQSAWITDLALTGMIANIDASCSDEYNHKHIKVPRHQDPFEGQPSLHTDFLDSLDQMDEVTLPRGWGIYDNEYEDDEGYPLSENIPLSGKKRSKQLTVTLPKHIWRPRANMWVKAVILMQAALQEESEEEDSRDEDEE